MEPNVSTSKNCKTLTAKLLGTCRNNCVLIVSKLHEIHKLSFCLTLEIDLSVLGDCQVKKAFDIVTY